MWSPSRPVTNIAVDFWVIEIPDPWNKMNWPTQFISHSLVYSFKHVQWTHSVFLERNLSVPRPPCREKQQNEHAVTISYGLDFLVCIPHTWLCIKCYPKCIPWLSGIKPTQYSLNPSGFHSSKPSVFIFVNYDTIMLCQVISGDRLSMVIIITSPKS